MIAYIIERQEFWMEEAPILWRITDEHFNICTTFLHMCTPFSLDTKNMYTCMMLFPMNTVKIKCTKLVMHKIKSNHKCYRTFQIIFMIPSYGNLDCTNDMLYNISLWFSSCRPTFQPLKDSTSPRIYNIVHSITSEL